jgi:hypothetical protein
VFVYPPTHPIHLPMKSLPHCLLSYWLCLVLSCLGVLSVVLHHITECSDTCTLLPPADKQGFPCYQGSAQDAHICFDTVRDSALLR